MIAAGLLLMLYTLLAGLRAGAPAGPNPWGAPTLEWRTSSPPPEYNFAVVPRVTSAYPGWDEDDVADDARRLGTGELVLDRDHQTPGTTMADAWLDEVLDLPAGSWVPIALASCVALLFVMVLTSHYAIGGAFLALAGVCLVVWHANEPEEA